VLLWLFAPSLIGTLSVGIIPNPYVNCLQYLFVLSLMLLGELSVIILSALAPQSLGLVFDSGRLLAVLQRGYGTPGSEQLTAAIDLAQATVSQCLISL